MHTVPDAWVIYIRSGLSVAQAGGILGNAHWAALHRVDMGEAAKTARWHIEDMGEAGYLILIETMDLAGFVRDRLQQMSVEHKIASLLRLKAVQTTGSIRLDRAIIASIRALYGDP